VLYYLYWDESDGADPNTSKLRRSVHDTLEGAKAQAEADMAHGRNVIGIEEAKKPLGVSEVVVDGRNVVTFDRGSAVK
jgi:hypothetical protein